MTRKLCSIDNCTSRAVYNFKNQPSKYCKTHAQSGMLSTDHKICEYERCTTRANFGLVNEYPKFCSVHKTDKMIDKCNKHCTIDETCNIKATYGYVGKKPIACKEHSTKEMIDLLNRKCKYDTCKKQPTYNFAGLSALYCSDHANKDMIDVIHKTCKHETCNVIPTFGYKNQEATHCSTHKKDSMISYNSRKCHIEHCKKQPNFNFKDEHYGLYCKEHKSDIMVDVRSKKCPGFDENGCPFSHLSKKKYDFFCTQCFAHKFPTDERTPLIHNRSDELKTMYFVNKEFPTLNFIHDKPMWIDNCNCAHKRRVDLRTLIGNTILAIEIDEKQHKSKEQSDETTRYDDLYMLHSGKWIFIRFNPDSFKNNVNKRRNPSLADRLTILKQEITKQIEHIHSESNNSLVEISYLFYDGYEY